MRKILSEFSRLSLRQSGQLPFLGSTNWRVSFQSPFGRKASLRSERFGL